MRVTGHPPLRPTETRAIIEQQIEGLIERDGKGTFRETTKNKLLRSKIVLLLIATRKRADGETLSAEEMGTIAAGWPKFNLS